MIKFLRGLHLQQLLGLILLENDDRVVDADVETSQDSLPLLSCLSLLFLCVRVLPQQRHSGSPPVCDRSLECDGLAINFGLVCIVTFISQGDLYHRLTTPLLNKVLNTGEALRLLALGKESEDETQHDAAFPTAVDTSHKIYILVGSPETSS